MTVPDIVIVGAGVNGLTVGIRLLEQFEHVAIIAEKLSPDTTSDVAGAFWEPYKAYPWERVRQWAQLSLEEFYKLSQLPTTGVSIVNMLTCSKEMVELPEWAQLARTARVASSAELPSGFPYGFVIEIPRIEPPIYMPYLLQRFKESGGVVQQVTKPCILSDLYASERIIVNCTGIGARQFCNDPEVFPIRGQVVCVSRPRVDTIFDATGPTYVVPRSHDCILGGTSDSGDWNLDPDPATAERILTNCQQLVPEINKCEVLAHRVGLRPGRREVKLELEKIDSRCAVVHNYGHGGAGFTLSWGCAAEATELVSKWTTSTLSP